VLAGVADLSLLKFRERDALEMAFKTWGVKVPYDGASVRQSPRPVPVCITVGGIACLACEYVCSIAWLSHVYPWVVLCIAVANLRDARLRHYYGQRYDSRTNVADWDYHVSTQQSHYTHM
jgi:hypothetical protein